MQQHDLRPSGRRAGKSARSRAARETAAAIRSALPARPPLTAEEDAVLEALSERLLDGIPRIAAAAPAARPDLVEDLCRALAVRAVAALHPQDRGETRVDYLGLRDSWEELQQVPVELSGPTGAHAWIAEQLRAGYDSARVVVRTTTLRELR